MQMTVSDHQPVQPHIPVDVALEEGCVQMASSPHPAITEHKTDGTAAGRTQPTNQPVLTPSGGTGGGQASGTETSTQSAGARTGTSSGPENTRYPGCSFDIQITYGESEKASRARMDDYFQRLSADIVRFMSNPVR